MEQHRNLKEMTIRSQPLWTGEIPLLGPLLHMSIHWAQEHLVRRRKGIAEGKHQWFSFNLDCTRQRLLRLAHHHTGEETDIESQDHKFTLVLMWDQIPEAWILEFYVPLPGVTISLSL
jgi:hypothetical protein